MTEGIDPGLGLRNEGGGRALIPLDDMTSTPDTSFDTLLDTLYQSITRHHYLETGSLDIDFILEVMI